MRGRTLCLILALALVGCDRDGGARVADDPARAESARVAVAVHGGTAKQAERVLRVVDTAWLTAAEPFGVEGAVPDPKPTVHLYLRAGDYDEADRRLTGGRFTENRAFAQHESHSAHVDLQPRLDGLALADGPFPAQTERLLAHETAHLVRYSLLADGHRHPRWLADGTAIVAADRTMRSLNGGFGPEAEPFTSTLIALAQRAQAYGELPTYGDLLRGRTQDLAFLERYAVHYAAFRLLLEGPHFEGVEAFLRSLRTEPPETGDGIFARRLERALGLDGLDLLDRQLVGYLDTLRPQWIELRRSLETTPPRWDHVAYGDGDATAWRLSDAGSEYTISGLVDFRRGASGRMSILLGRQPDGHVAVHLVPGEGLRVVRRHTTEGRVERETELARASVRGLPGGWPFEVRVDGTSLEILIDGLPSARLHRRPNEVDVRLEGPWGLEVEQGAAGAWVDLEHLKER